MSRIQFEIEGKPQGKQRPQFVLRGNKTVVYTPKETIEYEDLVRMRFVLASQNKPLDLWDKLLFMRIMAYYPIPKSFNKQEKIAAREGILRPGKKPDNDNIEKIVCDSLNGLAYKDDAQIVDSFTSKYYADIPKVIVMIFDIESAAQKIRKLEL